MSNGVFSDGVRAGIIRDLSAELTIGGSLHERASLSRGKLAVTVRASTSINESKGKNLNLAVKVTCGKVTDADYIVAGVIAEHRFVNGVPLIRQRHCMVIANNNGGKAVNQYIFGNKWRGLIRGFYNPRLTRSELLTEGIEYADPQELTAFMFESMYILQAVEANLKTQFES